MDGDCPLCAMEIINMKPKLLLGLALVLSGGLSIL